MAFLQTQTRPAAAAPITLASLFRAALRRIADRPRKSPEDILAAQARRAEARAATDRLLR